MRNAAFATLGGTKEELHNSGLIWTCVWVFRFCLPVKHREYQTKSACNFQVYEWDPSKLKLSSSTFMWCYCLCSTRWFQCLRLWMKPQRVTIQKKAIEQYFHLVLFITLYKVVLTFQSVDETLLCEHSNESYWAVLSCGTVYYAVQFGSNVQVCGSNPSAWPFRWKLVGSNFTWCCLLCFPKWLQFFILQMKP